MDLAADAGERGGEQRGGGQWLPLRTGANIYTGRASANPNHCCLDDLLLLEGDGKRMKKW